uniref:Tryptophan synthase alpha chain n=1 Tax=Porolithon onkodes TaxID=231751 RepID=A0A2Z2KSB7_9FLOR|nr:tryptophan synthase alpha subunit [Porolithon onkodes]ASB29806.1 tryptophan synthase alpha subunit [Porolithon onkodes]
MLTISKAILNTNLKSSLVPFITAGYPSLSATSKLIHLLDAQGVNAIELGIPYSDALADGPVIQESSRVALNQKVYFEKILELVNQECSTIQAPIIIFTYLNPILSRGISIFIKEIADAGVKGLIIPDLPIEEADYFIALCKLYSIELILFVSLTSSEARIKQIVLKAPGCIYLVSSYGVTGERRNLHKGLPSVIAKIRQYSDKPIMLGFGISNENQVAEIMRSNLAINAIVMGSVFIKKIANNGFNNSFDNIKDFCQKIKQFM